MRTVVHQGIEFLAQQGKAKWSHFVLAFHSVYHYQTDHHEDLFFFVDKVFSREGTYSPFLTQEGPPTCKRSNLSLPLDNAGKAVKLKFTN
jgi:hypothetical protein